MSASRGGIVCCLAKNMCMCRLTPCCHHFAKNQLRLAGHCPCHAQMSHPPCSRHIVVFCCKHQKKTACKRHCDLENKEKESTVELQE